MDEALRMRREGRGKLRSVRARYYRGEELKIVGFTCRGCNSDPLSTRPIGPQGMLCSADNSKFDIGIVHILEHCRNACSPPL